MQSNKVSIGNLIELLNGRMPEDWVPESGEDVPEWARVFSAKNLAESGIDPRAKLENREGVVPESRLGKTLERL